MTIFSIFLISFALASDAFMVTVSYALTQKLTFKDRLKISGFFGLFQSKMTVLGWSFCLIFPSAIAPYDHFIAFILLSCIGLNMIQHGKKSKRQ